MNLETSSPIGKGGYSKVYKLKLGEKEYAMKRILNDSNTVFSSFFNEVHVLMFVYLFT